VVEQVKAMETPEVVYLCMFVKFLAAVRCVEKGCVEKSFKPDSHEHGCAGQCLQMLQQEVSSR